MTLEQEANEQSSVDAFVAEAVRQVRPIRRRGKKLMKGSNAAVTRVILDAAYAAADMAERDATGAIDPVEAGQIFQDAIRLMRAFKPSRPPLEDKAR